MYIVILIWFNFFCYLQKYVTTLQSCFILIHGEELETGLLSCYSYEHLMNLKTSSDSYLDLKLFK